MFKYLLSLVMLLAMSAVTFACPCVGNDEPCQCDPSCQCEMRADAAYGVKYTEERVLQLPQDQHKHYLTVIGNPADARFVEIQGWFKNHEHLKAIKDQTHFNAISTTSVMFIERYKNTVPATPCVRLQDADGVTIFQASGDNLPMSPDALSNAVKTECLRRRKNNPPVAPPVAPLPDPAPQPLGPALQPDVQPAVTEGSDWPAPMALAGCILAGLVIGGSVGVAKEYKKTHYPE